MLMAYNGMLMAFICVFRWILCLIRVGPSAFPMNSLPDSCWALRVSDEFSAWFVYRARPGPSALDGRLQKKRVLEKTDMLYIRKRACLSRFQRFPRFPWSQVRMSVVPSAQVPIYTRTPHWIAIPGLQVSGYSEVINVRCFCFPVFL